jgi:hypothetical protein
MILSPTRGHTVLGAGLVVFLLQPPAAQAVDAAARSRTFLFTYAATVTDLPASQTARIWLPVPPSNQDQDVAIVSKEVPAGDRRTRERRYGNRILYAEGRPGPDGTIALSVTYRVTRREVKADRHLSAEDERRLFRYLQPDIRVPITGKPLDLIKDKALPKDQLAAARVLYDTVNSHMRYSKEGTGWGRGDAVWACESGYGNCSDFHSLFIALARSQKIPAKFEIGFSLPPQRGSGEISGYHCWAKFRPTGEGWVPVDISEANKDPSLRDYYFGNLSENRLMFSTGRDLELDPPHDGPPVNFLIYPYVEVGGKQYPDEKVKRQFTYRDVAAGASK